LNPLGAAALRTHNALGGNNTKRLHGTPTVPLRFRPGLQPLASVSGDDL